MIIETEIKELIEQLRFDAEGLGFNHDVLVMEYLKEELGIETEPLSA